MKLKPLEDLFDITYGNSFELNSLERCAINDPERVNYVSRTREQNGVSAFVKERDEPPFGAGLITVAGSGNSVLESFVQEHRFYTGYHVFVLTPKRAMTEVEKLFYCFCIRQNQYKYNFGRQANRTLKSILVPESMPKDFQRIELKNIQIPDSEPLIPEIELNLDKWGKFRLDELFEIKKGKRLTKENMEIGSTPFIGSSDSNNGYTAFVSNNPIHQANTITVNYDGSVGIAFYQPVAFWALDSVNVLYPKFKLNPYIALFIITVIEQERYRFNYGRKWHKDRMEKSIISLPVKNKKPDFEWMENYIKSLPYSTAIPSERQEVITHKIVKPNSKGLSDEELIKKYESGKVNMKKAIEPMLVEPKE